MALITARVFWVETSDRSGRCTVTQHADHRAGAPAKTLTKMDVAGAGRRWWRCFVGIALNKAFNAEAGPLIAVCMGVITGVGGGIICDVLALRNPHDFTYRNLRNCRDGIGGIVDATAYYTFSVPLVNSQYDGHGRDAIDSAGGYSLASKLPNVCAG
ncbi:TRIC cation channel family protein [Escherichia coli]